MLTPMLRGSGRPEGAVGTSVRSFGEEIFVKYYRYIVIQRKRRHSKCLYVA